MKIQGLWATILVRWRGGGASGGRACCEKVEVRLKEDPLTLGCGGVWSLMHSMGTPCRQAAFPLVDSSPTGRTMGHRPPEVSQGLELNDETRSCHKIASTPRRDNAFEPRRPPQPAPRTPTTATLFLSGCRLARGSMPSPLGPLFPPASDQCPCALLTGPVGPRLVPLHEKMRKLGSRSEARAPRSPRSSPSLPSPSSLLMHPSCIMAPPASSRLRQEILVGIWAPRRLPRAPPSRLLLVQHRTAPPRNSRPDPWPALSCP